MSSIARSVIRFLGSRRLAVATMLAWMGLVLVWVVPFQIYGLPESQLHAIVYDEAFFLLVYALLVINTVACIVPRIPEVFRSARRGPSPDSTPALPGDAVSVGTPWEPERAADVLRRSRFRRVVVAESWAWGVRRRYSSLGTLLLHLGYLLVIAAAIINVDSNATFVGMAVVAEGETFTGDDRSYSDIITTATAPPALSFTLRNLEPAFYEDILLFTKLQGVVADAGGEEHALSLSSPWIVSPTTVVAIEDFGYAPVVSGSNAEVAIDARSYKLKAFPAGLGDSLNLDGIGEDDYTLDVQIFGDYVDRDGEPGSASFNLADPRIETDVYRRLSDGSLKLLSEDQLVGLGEPIAVEDATIVFEDITYYGVFRITRSYAAPFIFVGLVIVSIGAIMRLLLPRQEALIAKKDDSAVVVVNDDTFRRSPHVAQRIAQRWEGDR